jgi:hypothetical protein
MAASAGAPWPLAAKQQEQQPPSWVLLQRSAWTHHVDQLPFQYWGSMDWMLQSCVEVVPGAAFRS